MKNTFRSTVGIVLGCFYALSALAISPIQVHLDQKIPQGAYQVGVGSPLTMKVGSAKSVAGTFLGAVINPDGTFSKYMLMDSEHSQVYFANQENVKLPKESYQLLLKPYDQVGGTCTGYAIDHYFQQMYWSGFKGNGNLKNELSTEKGRTQLLVDSINEYYLVLQHRYSLKGVMNKIASRFAFKCKSKSFADVHQAVQFVQDQTKVGTPVMVSFSIGSNMVDAPFQLRDYETKSELDNRLWVPRKKGERNGGGHTIVAAASFEVRGRSAWLMLDSDWSEPRIWDVNAYFTEKTVMDEIEFITCQ